MGIASALVALSQIANAAPVLTGVAVGTQTPEPVCQASNATYTVTVTRTGGGNLDVYLAAHILPAGAKAVFSPNLVHFTGSAVMSATATLVVSTTEATPPGANSFSVTAQDGGSPNLVSNTAVLDVRMRCAGVARMAAGWMCVALNAPTNQMCCLQATTNLAFPNWTTLCVTNSGTNSLLVYADKDSAKFSCRFYRLTLP
jgi:hypothetical protein